MHPDLLRALARARHDDLLLRRPTPQARTGSGAETPRFVRARRRMGLVLIWAGTRVMGGGRAAMELAHD